MADGYRLVSFCASDGRPHAGVKIGERIHPAEKLLPAACDTSSVLAMLRDWDRMHPLLDKAAAQVDPAAGMAERDVNLLAPILYPGALFCAGANYWDHLEEMAEIAKRTTGKALSMIKGAEPWFFLKTCRGSIVGPGSPVRLPSFSKQVDWEGELGVVIARPTRRFSERRAMEAIAGFVIVHDLSARDLMKRESTPFIYDWIGQKCFDDSAPMGPWLTPAAYVRDPNNLRIKLSVNGVMKQDSNTGRMVHSIAEQIAYLSRHVTLQPGDVIATGSPAGVGLPKGEFLKIGDRVEIEIEGCGTLVNTMIADDSTGRQP
jgi:2-keto-4-pentenoate hydratase/2-oxohepta-3-ene-1,7-dioic acid hydratase in catechol pathway